MIFMKMFECLKWDSFNKWNGFFWSAEDSFIFLIHASGQELLFIFDLQLQKDEKYNNWEIGLR